MPNLRILYNNLAPQVGVTLTSSSTASVATSSANLLTDSKSKVFRSGTATLQANTKAIFVLDLGSSKQFNCVILPFTNLTATATITVKTYTATPSTSQADPPVLSGGGTVTTAYPTALAAPWAVSDLPNWGTLVNSAASYAFGGGNHAVAWFTSTSTARYLSVEIEDVNQTLKYVEVSKLLVGKYWAPRYNTSFGVKQSVTDSSTHERTESGNLVSSRKPRFSTLAFDLGFLDATDRLELSRILLGNGIAIPMFASIFPENGTSAVQREQERVHMIYGKQAQNPAAEYFAPNLYRTNLELEEI